MKASVRQAHGLSKDQLLAIAILLLANPWVASAKQKNQADSLLTKDIAGVEVRATRVDYLDEGARRWYFPDSVYVVSRMVTEGKTTRSQESDDRKDDCPKAAPGQQTAGNPVVLYTGNKVEVETDFAATGEMPLHLQRVYNHHWSAAGIFGNHWLSNFDYSLAFSDANNVAWLQRPDGRRIKFLLDTASGRWYEDRAQPVAYLSKLADGSYSLYNEERGTEAYNADGYITQRKNEQGVYWNFTYNNRYLQKVTHSSGRSVQFTWNGNQLTQVTDPAGNAYRYTYTANVFSSGRGRLASTQLPGTPSTTIQYHYEDARYPGGLTGKSFNGVRYSTFAYDGQRRAISTEHSGGIERFQFSYSVQSTEQVQAPPAPPAPGGLRFEDEQYNCSTRQFSSINCVLARGVSGRALSDASSANLSANSVDDSVTRAVKTSVSVVNPLGRRTTYSFEDGRQVAVAGDASPRCPTSYKDMTYDSNGYPDVVADFNEVLTDYDYDAQGRLVKTVEAAGTPLQRTTNTVWNSSHRVIKESTPGAAEVEYTYDSRGNITRTRVRNLTPNGVTNQYRDTNIAYTYHSNGLKASMKVDGPLANDDVKYTFNTKGDLTTVTDGLGHTTTYANYNGLGMAGRITGPNGDIQEATFDARGRVISQRRSMGNGWITSSIAYDATGNVASVTAPTGVVTRYEYDAGRRLLREVSPLADGTYSWTQHSHDAASNVVRSEVRHTDYPLGSTVIGYIDDLLHDASWNWYFKGWACSTGQNSSIEVRGNTDAGGTLGSTTANLSNEPEVSHACQATGTRYRFEIPITLEQRQQMGGQRIDATGISARGSAFNRVLSRVADFVVPPAPIKGDISGITHDENWNYFVEGWACSVGVNESISVHLYTGGPAGSGVLALGHPANLSTGVEVANACQSQGTAYRFRIPLDANLRAAQGGKSIYIHGISPVSGQPNLLIANSGTYTVPAVVRSAQNTGLTAAPNNITNGEAVSITVQFRNTGTTVWGSETYLAWGNINLNAALPLSGTVNPGELATFSTTVSPVNPQSGSRYFEYSFQLASNGAAWGPKVSTGVTVHNTEWVCTGRHCEAPMRIGKDGDVELQGEPN